MRNRWYGDNRDLIKWGGIRILCSDNTINKVLWVAYLREEEWTKIRFDDHSEPFIVPEIVLHHFKSIPKNMRRLCENMDMDIILVDDKIDVKYNHKERTPYANKICEYIRNNTDENKVVFLDPDTGLEPKKCKVTNVSETEVEEVWNSLKAGDYLVFYQHRFRDKRWREVKKKALSDICDVSEVDVKMWYGDDSTTNKYLAQLAKDVVFYFIKKVT